MFLQASVCPRVGRGVHPQGPPRQTSPWAPPRQTPTPTEMATVADGTHPTGIHSCFCNIKSLQIYLNFEKYWGAG